MKLKDFVERGGRPLIKLYGSMNRLLAAVYPEACWDGVRFVEVGGRTPSQYWADINNHRELLDRIGERLGIIEVPFDPLHG